MTNSKSYKFSDLVNIIGGGTPKTSVAEYWNGNIPWLSVVDFGGDRKTVYTTEKRITEKGLKESSTKLSKKGQLIISARGTVGELAVLGADMAFNQSCYGLDAKPELAINNFLYYLLKYKIESLKSVAHGSVFDTITRQTFEQLEVNLPDLPTQHRIAEILSALDDKIELNRRMNQTLEQMAQTLFRQYFVDGIDEENLPEGWK
jgi:type I restriction enzyme, S subunit